MNGNGKIAKLPREVREKLNRRLAEDEGGEELLKWLNGQPEVKDLIAREFDGKPIGKMNLSRWKEGGFRRWQLQQEKTEWVRQLTEEAAELKAEGGGPVADRLALVTAVELAVEAREAIKQITDPGQRFQRQRELLVELMKMRREDHKAGHLELAKERRVEEKAKHEYEVVIRKEKLKKIELKNQKKARVPILEVSAIEGWIKGGDYQQRQNGINMALDLIDRVLELLGKAKELDEKEGGLTEEQFQKLEKAMGIMGDDDDESNGGVTESNGK